jgi:hypothetical protein
MKFEKCLICGEYGWESHRCNPEFYIFRENYEIEDSINYAWPMRSYRASDYEDAAVKFCEYDFEIPESLEVWVISKHDYENVIDNNVSEKEDQEVARELLKYCKHFGMESEVVRNFYATQIDK